MGRDEVCFREINMNLVFGMLIFRCFAEETRSIEVCTDVCTDDIIIEYNNKKFREYHTLCSNSSTTTTFCRLIDCGRLVIISNVNRNINPNIINIK